MKILLKTIFSFLLMSKFILIIIVFLSFMPISLIDAMEEGKQSSIKIEEMTFEEIITALSNIFDIEIVLISTIDLPRQKLSLTLEQATLKQAINEAMRKSGLLNHALVINQEKNITRIWILNDGLSYDIDRPWAYTKMKTTTSCD